MKQNSLKQALFVSGAVLTVAGSFAKLFDYPIAFYIFTVGALLIIFVHGQDVFDKTKTDKSEQRLARMGLFNSLFLAVAAYFMYGSSNSWVVMVLIYALTTFYLSFRSAGSK